MSLTGSAFALGLGVLVLVCAAATLYFWSRFPHRWGWRLPLLVANQIAAVLFVGALVNDAGGFYATWAALLSNNGTSSADNPSSGSRTPGPNSVSLGPAPPFASPAHWRTRGRLESVTVHGSTSALTAHAYVYLPPQYFQARYAHTTFPTVEVLTGFPGRDADMIEGLDFPRIMLGLITSRRAEPAVLVMMRPAVTYPRDTECTDVPTGPLVQTFFTADVPDAVARTYRVRPTHWGVIGISTGGYCAAKFALTDPSMFSAAASLSGYYVAVRNAGTGDLWGASTVLRHLNDLEWRLRHLPVPPAHLLVTAVRTEPAYADLRSFLPFVRPPLQVASTVLPSGGHNIPTFRREEPAALAWLLRQLPSA